MRPRIVLFCLLASIGIARSQESIHTYVPPPTSSSSFELDKPLVDAFISRTGDRAAFHRTIENLANSGDVNAQIMMAGAYMPQECTYLPFKVAPIDCPNDQVLPNSFGVTPSFENAMSWLRRASGQGNGEASEMLAQLLERAIRSSARPNAQMVDVARLHALARSQGFDLQDVDYTCYSLEDKHTTGSLTMAEKTPNDFVIPPDQLAAMRAAGASGVLHWRVRSNQPNMTVALRHPEGPKVHMTVIVSQGANSEITVPMPNRADIVYLQHGDHVLTFPPAYPTIARSVAFRPATGNELGGAFFQTIDGDFTAICRPPGTP